VQMNDDHICNMDGVGTVLIKMFDGMVRELKDVRYIPQIKKNLISVVALEAHGLEFSDRDRLFKVIQWLYGCVKGCQAQQYILVEG